MGADAIAVIRPALDELADAIEEEGEGDEVWCVSFTVPDEGDRYWIQVLEGTLNFGYPHQADPAARLALALGPKAKKFSLVEWEPEQFATFEFDAVSLDDLAEVIDQLFQRVQEVPDPDYAVEFELARV